MKKGIIIASVFTVFALTLMKAEAAQTPNIIFVLCDDLGYGDIGVFYQNKRAALNDRSIPFFSTPNIDTLARYGVEMKQHYCGAPVCAPSRASLLTGVTQGNASVRDNQFDKELADTHTLDTVLQKAGYAVPSLKITCQYNSAGTYPLTTDVFKL